MTSAAASPQTEAFEGAKGARARPRRRRNKIREVWWIYLFLLPTIVGYGGYTVYPLLATWWYGLLDWPGFAATGKFIGIGNFRHLIHDPLFWNAFRHSLEFMVVGVPLRVGLALFLALVLNAKRTPLKGLFRTLFFLPVVTTGAIVGIVFTLILDATGPVNFALVKASLLESPVNFVADAHTSLWTGVAVWTWKWLGITLIYWLAALQTISRDVHEASQIDGATAWREFRHVTLPLLKPFLIIITLIDTVAALNVFDLLQTLTAGGPTFSSEVVEIFIFRNAFKATIPQLGYASAAATLFGVITIAFALVQALGVRAARRRAAM